MVHSKLGGIATRLHLQDVYTRLDPETQEIRLLVLKRAQNEGNSVHCSVRKVSLRSEPPPVYETVSYVWGDVKLKDEIFIHGRATLVGESAVRVLRRFRERDRDRVLWIDAVCINQGDIEERSQQVAMMAAIYSRCINVLIWLGEDNSFAARASCTINTLIEDAKLHTNGLARFRDTIINEDGDRVFNKTGFDQDLDLDALFDLYSAPWFKRLWVIQEAALPPKATVYCGTISMQLGVVLRAMRWMYYKYLPHSQREGDLCARIATIWSYVDREHGPWAPGSPWKLNLFNLLVDLRTYGAWDDKDHVYGLLGLYEKYIGTHIPLPLAPDYSRSLRTILRDVTRLAIESRKHWPLDTLAYLYRDPTKDAALPTWVPAWHRGWEAARDSGPLASFRKADDGKEMLRSIGAAMDADILIAAGQPVGRITNVSSIFEYTASGSTGYVRAWFQECHRYAVNQGDIDETSLARTMAADCTYDQEQWAAKELLEGWRSWMKYFEVGDSPPFVSDSTAESPRAKVQVSQYDNAMVVACANRRFFCTVDRRIGIGPRTMEVGDVVTVLYGCRWPIVLKPRGIEGHYDVRGVAYVDGIMYGELVRERGEEGIAPIWFHLH